MPNLKQTKNRWRKMNIFYIMKLFFQQKFLLCCYFEYICLPLYYVLETNVNTSVANRFLLALKIADWKITFCPHSWLKSVFSLQIYCKSILLNRIVYKNHKYFHRTQICILKNAEIRTLSIAVRNSSFLGPIHRKWNFYLPSINVNDDV